MGAICCSNKDTLLPRLQQSWCSRGWYNAAHASRKQLFKFPWGSSNFFHVERMQANGVVRKQKQELMKIPTPPPLVKWPWLWITKKQTNTSTSLGLFGKLKINKRKWGPRLSDKCLGRRVHLRAESTEHSLHWVTLQHETAEQLTDVYLVTQWKLTPFRTGKAWEITGRLLCNSRVSCLPLEYVSLCVWDIQRQVFQLDSTMQQQGIQHNKRTKNNPENDKGGLTAFTRILFVTVTCLLLTKYKREDLKTSLGLEVW